MRTPETRILLVPSPEKLSAELRAAVEAAGLRVIALDGDWHLEAARRSLATALLKQCGPPPLFGGWSGQPGCKFHGE